jgi:hypothetical protein
MQLGESWPVRIDYQWGQIVPNPSSMGALMSILAAVPPSTIKALAGDDFPTCAQALTRFFLPRVQAT